MELYAEQHELCLRGRGRLTLTKGCATMWFTTSSDDVFPFHVHSGMTVELNHSPGPVGVPRATTERAGKP